MAILAFGGVSVVSRREFLRLGLAGGSLLLGIGAEKFCAAAPTQKLPDWKTVEQTAKSTLASRQGYQPGDLLAKSDVQGVLTQLQQLGWEVANRQELQKKTLDDGHFLVKELRTTAGLKFSRAVQHDDNVFDRLDRLSEYSGGHKLIDTIVHLPDGTKLMLNKPTPGFSDLMSLLPKQANGLTPTNKDFSKPTGKIYNETELLKALADSYVKATKVVTKN